MANQLDEVYYETLQKIESKYFPTANKIPLDGPFIRVDLDSRVITLDDELQDFLSVEEDHRAENLFIEVNRYYEDVDLFNTTCVVEYINAKGQARIYPITLYDIDSLREDGKMIMAWCIGNEATAAAGTLQFALHFYTLNPDSKTFVYSLRTRTAKGNILHGMELSPNQEIEKDDYYTISENHYMELLAIINQKKVYWNDL